MQSIGSLIQLPVKSKISHRGMLIKDIIELYNSPQEVLIRKKKNWERYIIWLKENRYFNDATRVKEFKNSRLFLKQLSDKTIAIMLSHVKEHDLPIVQSMCREKLEKGYSIGAYLFSIAYPKKGVNN